MIVSDQDIISVILYGNTYHYSIDIISYMLLLNIFCLYTGFRDGPFNFQGGGGGGVKIFWLWWRKTKIIWFRVFVI